MMKTAEELGITAAEHAALLRVREWLGRAPWVEWVRYEEQLAVEGTPMMFNMSTTVADAECGTICCVGGAMALLMGECPHEYVFTERSAVLHPLFFPTERELEEYRPEDAVEAIDHFLETGRVAPW